jgi:hypothetical protein
MEKYISVMFVELCADIRVSVITYRATYEISGARKNNHVNLKCCETIEYQHKIKSNIY